MSDKRLRARARAVVTIEVDLDGAWGENCDLAQVYKQAEDELRNKLENWRSSKYEPSFVQYRLIGEPKITAILVEDK